MNKNINLCEILKGHEGEEFYCSLIDDNIKLIGIDEKNKILKLKNNDYYIELSKSCITKTNLKLFPSKIQQDWNKWNKTHNKIPKIWNDILYSKNYENEIKPINDIAYDADNSNICKAVVALLKINKLIEVGYGGNVTNETWNSQKDKWLIIPIHDKESFSFTITRTTFFVDKCHIAFNSQEQAEEFLSYPENVQLLKDYFMI